MKPLLLASLLVLGCGSEPSVHVVGNVPTGEPAQICTHDTDCSGPCHSGTCIEKACTARVPHPNGVTCDDGPSYSECKDGFCTLKPHDSEVCGEVVATEFPSSKPNQKAVVLCDACSSSCDEIFLTDTPCTVHGSCCEGLDGVCVSTCVGCCDGESSGKATLRCTHPAM